MYTMWAMVKVKTYSQPKASEIGSINQEGISSHQEYLYPDFIKRASFKCAP